MFYLIFSNRLAILHNWSDYITLWLPETCGVIRPWYSTLSMLSLLWDGHGLEVDGVCSGTWFFGFAFPITDP